MRAMYDSPDQLLLTGLSSVGNKRLRGVVDKNLARYIKAKSKHEKSQIVSDIVNTIRNNAGVGGFIKKVPSSSLPARSVHAHILKYPNP
jgi:hypothetical protein